ncbi:MAG TPA: L-rhamnose isomerase [Capsulimonadaceae bacterium]|nr:L-rhamnose isomerase [Capsulimonadaceae bacterium]
MARAWENEYKLLEERLKDSGFDIEATVQRLKKQHIETPSWAFMDGGTRFGVFPMAGAARTVKEKFEDAAQVHKYTGVAGSVAVHIPWDKVADWSEMGAYAKSLGVTIGAVNPNVFQEAEYQFGSFGNVGAGVRKKALAHMRECVEIMKETGSKHLSLWFADGTNFPGQGDFRARKQWFADCLAETYALLSPGQIMLIEYKPFEPGFYHTDIADWGMAFAFALHTGDRAKVLVDLGHHLHGANIEHIVAFLLDEGRLGGFHFNNRKYADDDLTVGSTQPYELFLIYNELASGEDAGLAGEVAYMIDQSHTLKNKIEEMIQSVVNLQTSYAKALLVDQKALAEAQEKNDVILAEETLRAAYDTDVAPLLWRVRSEMNLPDPSSPLAGFRKSGYAEEKAKERGVAKATSAFTAGIE